MSFDIKIYGAPYSFEVYDGSKEDSNYFQVFDNRRSTEPVKMTIDRLNSHQIVCNYLRYGYITSGGRTGSFFGLSVIFHGEYCSNFTKLYELFEVVYGTIVKNAVLIEALPNGECQAKYKISQFADAKGEVERVKGILAQNIQGRLANDFKPMSLSAPSYEDRELRLSTNTSNDIITNALSKYATVSISPSYSSGQGKEVETIPPKILMRIQGEKSDLLSKATDRLGKVTAFQSDLLAHQAAKQNLMPFYPKYQSIIDGLDGLIQSMERQLAEIGKWLKKDPANSLLTDAQKEIDASKKSLSKTYNSLLNSEGLFVGESGGSGSSSGSNSGGSSYGGGGNLPPTPWPWWKIFLDKYKNLLIAAVVVIAVVIGGLIVKKHHKQGEKPTTPYFSEVDHRCDSIMGLVRIEFEKSENENWVEAYNQCNKIVNDEGNKDYTRMKDAKDTLAKCQTNHHNYCMSQAVPGTKFSNKEKAISWVENEMKNVGSSLNDDDKKAIEKRFSKQSIHNAPAQSSPANNTTAAKDNITGNIKLQGVYVRSNTVVEWKRPFTLHFESNNTNQKITSIKWTLDDKDLGTGNDFEVSDGLSNTTKNHTIKCFVNGADNPAATARNIKCER